MYFCSKKLFTFPCRADYNKYSDGAEFIRNLDAIVTLALTEAERVGLGAIDSLRLAAAHLAGCAQFITTEKPTAPIYRSALVPVVYLFD